MEKGKRDVRQVPVAKDESRGTSHESRVRLIPYLVRQPRARPEEE